MEKKSALNVKI